VLRWKFTVAASAMHMQPQLTNCRLLT